MQEAEQQCELFLADPGTQTTSCKRQEDEQKFGNKLHGLDKQSGQNEGQCVHAHRGKQCFQQARCSRCCFINTFVIHEVSDFVVIY